ncbi:MAG: prepilin peptidase [Phycisphaerales bacterium]
MPELARYELLMTLLNVANVLFACAFGACIGSLVNVLVYRIPLGLDVVSPPSRCPNCETRLTWRENIPIFGWLSLGGKCRFCRSPISAEYPIVETAVAVAFGLVFLKLYSQGTFLGVPFNELTPAWSKGTFATTWPMMVIVLTLVGCLTAITLIDARTFFIPLVLTWVPAGAAVVLTAVQFALVTMAPEHERPRFAASWDWSIATPGPSGWMAAGAAAGAGLGLLISNLLLACGVIRRSYHDYDTWLEARQKELGVPQSPNDPGLWLEYPHARREAIREIFFLAPAIILAVIGSRVGLSQAGTWNHLIGLDMASDLLIDEWHSSNQLPHWASVAGGVLMGYLIGGGAVWLFRILGTLVKGQDAMGMGDVHLMAAVGACLGWPTAVLGFFAAAFVGLVWNFRGVFKVWRLGTLARRVSTHRHQLELLLKGCRFGRALRMLSGTPQQMPFGPYLAIGTFLVWYFQPLVERVLGPIFRHGVRFTLP